MKKTNNKATSWALALEQMRARIKEQKRKAREEIDRAEIEEQRAKRTARLLADLKAKTEEIAKADKAERRAIYWSAKLERLEMLGHILETLGQD